MTLPEIFEAAHHRDIGCISITDHDNIACQENAAKLAARHQMVYLSGVELNVRFSQPGYKNGKPVSLDLLGYGFAPKDPPLTEKLNELRAYRQVRARKILQNINEEFKKAEMDLFTDRDLNAIEDSVDGSFGRPHIAAYMVQKGIVKDKQEAFDRFLVKCDVPKMSVSIEAASRLIRGAGGKVVLAHPNDPNGTSLVALTPSIKHQIEIIEGTMRPFIDGVECWHSRHTAETSRAYQTFARSAGLMVTGGSDCHQDPIIMGSVPVPAYVYAQFEM